MNDVRASRRRVAKFAIPTLLCCILINIPKFFESKIEYYQDEYGNQIGKKLYTYFDFLTLALFMNTWGQRLKIINL